VSNHFKNDNFDLENFNEAFYIQENEKYIKKINDEFALRNRNHNLQLVDNSQKIDKPNMEKLFFTLKKFLKNLYNEQILIMKELLKRTLDKFDSYSIKSLLYFDLISVTIKGYEKEADGHIEYIIELLDKLLNKSWEFKARFSKLRRLHLETKFSLALEGKNFEISEFPHRRWFGNGDDVFIEFRKRKLQAYFDSYIKNKNSFSLIDKGILRHFFYREIWADLWKIHLKNIKELDEANDFNKMSHPQMVSKINEIFEEVKTNLCLLSKNEALVFIYYQNKYKALTYQDSGKFKNSIL
jgi:hypothetical protein